MNDFKKMAKDTAVGAVILSVFVAVVLIWNFIVTVVAGALNLPDAWKTVVYFAPFALYLMYVMGGLYTLNRKWNKS